MADIVSEQPQPLARPRPEPVVSRKKFGAAYLVLAAIIGAAVGLIVVFSTRHETHPKAVSWSNWAPARPWANGTLGVREIADHVAQEYRTESGRALVGVVAGPMQVPNIPQPIPVSAILVGSGSAGVTPTRQRLGVAFPSAGAFFNLCGRSREGNCQVEGKPSVRRGELLLREALELSLYTFHYYPEADQIVLFLPPAPGVPQNDPHYHRAVYLTRENLADELGAPLAATLDPRPISPASFSTPEANAVLGDLRGRLFHFDYQQAPNSSLLLVLTPLEPYG